MKKQLKEPEIKEGASGSFFVKIGNDNIGGFFLKEHAELFLRALKGEDVQELIAGLKMCLPHMNAYCGASNSPVINSESEQAYYMAKDLIEKFEKRNLTATPCEKTSTYPKKS